MAIFTSVLKYFEVTAISFTPNIITAGEETTYTIKVKNVSGKKISGMYAQMRLYYRATDEKVHGSNAVFVYGGPTFDLKSISWASGATKTFTGKFAFTPTPAYPLKSDTRLISMFKGSDAGFSESFGGNERLGLYLDITTNATFSDGGNVDAFFDLRGANSEYLYVIDARYKPTIPVFAAERSTGSNLNDEGENLLADIALGKSAAARPEFMSLYMYYQDNAKPDIDPIAVNLTNLIPSALAAQIRTVISEVLDKNADWNLVLWFGDKYESTTASWFVSRSFANVHLSGASTGGVCFGSFSKATENNPLFQCYYPAEFEAGIKGGFTYQLGEVDTGGKWIDGRRIYRYVLVVSASLSGGAAAIGTLPSDIGTMIQTHGTMRDASNGNFRPIPYAYYANDNWTACYYVQADGIVQLQMAGGYSGTQELVIIFEYTKSTEEVSQ